MVNLKKRVIGVDVSSKILVMSFLNEEEKPIILNVYNLKKDIKKFLKQWRTEDCKIVVEATGSYRSKVLYYAYSLGLEVCQVSGLSIKKFAEAKN